MASRASSWRKATPRASAWSMPDVRHSSSWSDAVAGDCLQQPDLSVRRKNGHAFEECARGLSEPRRACEDRVADRGRDVIAVDGQCLDDEEWIAGGLAVQLVDIEVMRSGELRHGGR